MLSEYKLRHEKNCLPGNSETGLLSYRTSDSLERFEKTHLYMLYYLENEYKDAGRIVPI